jgi:protein-S-isoprenylcysteine O-methyltransferase Ste14
MERAFVWAGGGLFVFALAFTAWWYARTLGRTTSPADDRAVKLAFDAVLFSAFALHHSMFARTGVKSWIARAIPERLVRSLYVWIASLLLIAVCALWQPLGGVMYRAPRAAAILLTAVQLSGAAMTWRAARAIDALELAGIHQSAASEPLQITGPYRVVRHPIYLGWMLIVFFPATLTADRLAFAAISSVYLIVAIPWEERSLEAVFGDAYRRYKKTVPWRVIPYVY